MAKEENQNVVEETASSSLAIEGEQRPEPDNKDGKRGERPKADIEFFPAEALLLMDRSAVEPERRFLLVGISLAGMGAAPFTSRRPRREKIRFALVEGVSSSPSPSAGASSAPSRGLDNAACSPKNTKKPSPAPKRGSGVP